MGGTSMNDRADAESASVRYRSYVIQTGDDLAVPIPAELVQRAGLTAGSVVHLEETRDGVLLSTPDISEALDVSAQVARRFSRALRELGDA